MTNTPKRPEKKSEMIEVRVPYSMKQAFLERCEARGTSLSEAIREMIDADSHQPAGRMDHWIRRINPMSTLFKRHPRKAAGGAAGAIAAVALLGAAPSIASDGMAIFEEMDADQNNVITEAEFMAAVREEGIIWNPRADAHSPRRTVGLSELEGHTRSEFARYDRNRNGEITPYEFSGRYVPLMRASFVSLDHNVDETVSVDELAIALGGIGFQPRQEPREAAERLIAELDSDGDNRLSFREFMADS